MGDEELFEGFEGDNGITWYTLSAKGVEEIANWCRLHLELGRLLPEQFAGNEREGMTPEYRIALLVWFLIREAYENRELAMPGVEPGHLFPKDWDNDEPQNATE